MRGLLFRRQALRKERLRAITLERRIGDKLWSLTHKRRARIMRRT